MTDLSEILRARINESRIVVTCRIPRNNMIQTLDAMEPQISHNNLKYCISEINK